MTRYFFVTAALIPGTTASSPPCDSVDEALRGAHFMLGNGSESVWIVDNDGNLILPADQVRLRLSSPSSQPPAPVVLQTELW